MRRGFIINSTLLILIIPLLLLAATYAEISSYVMHSQAERSQAERTYSVVNFLEIELEKSVEISGKRAIIATIDYVATTTNFISGMANKTIAELIFYGRSSSLPGYDATRIMGNQTLEAWLSGVERILKKQGYILKPSKDEILANTEILVAPLDAFTIVIKIRIPNITIEDLSGKVIYSGSLPRKGYAYSIVNLNNLEDPFHSAMTKGRYKRSLRACEYAYSNISPPFTFAEGEGIGSGVLVGRFGIEFISNATHIVDSDTGYYITNLTINGVKVSPRDFILNNGDRGVLVFEGGKGSEVRWCSSLQYRINLTIQNNVGIDLDDYQIPLLISTAKGFTQEILDFIFSNTQTTNDQDIFRKGAAIEIYDSNCNPIPFWIEYWDPTNQKALIWIRDSIPNGGRKTYSLYFGSGTPTKGNGEAVFIFFDDFEDSTWTDKWEAVDVTPTQSNGELYIQGGNNVLAVKSKYYIGFTGSFSVRFRMKGEIRIIGNKINWDSGVGVEDNQGGILLFTDDIDPNVINGNKDSGEGIAIHRPWRNYLTTGDSGRSDITTYHTYEAIMNNVSEGYYDAKFKDVLDSNANSQNRLNDDYNEYYNYYYLRIFSELAYIYLVTDSEYDYIWTYYDYVLVRKRPNTDLLDDPYFNGITFYWKSTTPSDVIESKPTTSAKEIVNASVYDIQPFISCLEDQRYFALESGWSFFERLEGSNANHDKYVALAHKMQEELNYKPPSGYYPIGLVSFMIPHPSYDQKLSTLMANFGLTITNVSSADYYFLTYYFRHGDKVEGYRVWGISFGSYSGTNLSLIPFFLDENTAKEIFGPRGACELLYGYNCQ
ncbi:DUF2341 domain-containing protein [Pyrococcus furiosus DSM 3638]|uniref:DUF2341 domain-containing protein n=3 Tax=Pyrococcus furiosus TaxID=2261 RepID=A0A5C0XPM0_PYRFU|nr:DUF2341 domain-containing protein [Pyrococcus furiosus]AAL81428.1 hypothetical protein PF1304 [Pyrococcus furiosus DSM 3638]AFN04088.1 hypothetical protein PFC_05735 [Pyrococcus furiosus COM1]QEK78943.1 DUF2341 domain-containing protein [Pyrococcus furiosus DSM 3638]